MLRAVNLFISIIFLCGSIIMNSGCESSMRRYYESTYTSDLYDKLGYNLSSPDTVLELPAALTEISGLDFINDTLLAAIQDENGSMYIINNTSGIIEFEIKFWKKGDFEGIEIVNNTVYALKSNGKIYRFTLDFTMDEIESGEFKTDLSSKNNAEGLVYDEKNHRLLIACKGDGEVDNNSAKGKSIYAFDLHTMEINDEPVYSVRKKDIKKQINDKYSDMKLKDSFSPSGIAIHPFSGKVFLIAHAGKALIVLNDQREIEEYFPLNPLLFRQPEGICFTPEGVLFISNEARGRKPSLMKFTYHP